MFSSPDKTTKASTIIIILTAIALQIQLTLFASTDYLGLRLSLADLFLPLIGLYTLATLLTKKTEWPAWSPPYMYAWLAALIIIMTTALANGYIVTGHISQWAFVNKYIGFFVLLAYLGLGAWITTNTGETAQKLFMTAFTAFFLFTATLTIAAFVVQYATGSLFWLTEYPWDGFMANRNALMIMFLLTATFVLQHHIADTPIMPPRLVQLFWLCAPTCLMYNASRAGWLACALLIIILLIKNPRLCMKRTAPVLLVGILLAYGSTYIAIDAHSQTLPTAQMNRLIAAFGDTPEYVADNNRYIALEDGLELYKKHDPIIGAGLGSYKPYQIEKRGGFVDIMDSTPLWLLVETGALGLLTFAGFFLTCAWTLFKQNTPYHHAMLTFLIIFAAMTLLHELLYTRALWFAVGLALASSAKSLKN